MDAFYHGDLEDIFDSDLDPTESLKISSDHDMHDWFLDRDVKDPAVILNDKLISDALLNGTLPIKTEHSYSLNSDGDSLPDSPRSLQAKIDDMDDECYPAISLKTATSARATIDPKCLTLHPHVHGHGHGHSHSPPAIHSSRQSNSSSHSSGGSSSSHAYVSTAEQAATVLARNGLSLDSLKAHNSSLNGNGNGGSVAAALEHFQLPQHLAAMYDNDCSSSVSSDICSDIEIDEAAIKDEPMSPDSSCPASPTSHSAHSLQSLQSAQQQHATALSLNLANLQAELLFDQKHGGLLLSSSSNESLIKPHQQLLMGNGSQSLMLSKIAIKSEKQCAGNATLLTGSGKGGGGGGGAAYGIPLTPPSSLPSDDSEGNLTPEHLFSPMSPNASVSISVANIASANGGAESSSSSSSSSNITRRSGSGGSSSAASSTTTRQPIHTPLISSQPKGSTGTLLLTEEEKRTLLAEGYPIPQKLPLTKAEEKSLKKIRRKIKNKISAQESRRKKKEYMDQLERRVEVLVTENHDYKKRIESLEETNASLLSQLHKLQTLVSKHNVKKS